MHPPQKGQIVSVNLLRGSVKAGPVIPIPNRKLRFSSPSFTTRALRMILEVQQGVFQVLSLSDLQLWQALACPFPNNDAQPWVVMWVGFSSELPNRAIIVWQSEDAGCQAVAYNSQTGAVIGICSICQDPTLHSDMLALGVAGAMLPDQHAAVIVTVARHRDGPAHDNDKGTASVVLVDIHDGCTIQSNLSLPVVSSLDDPDQHSFRLISTVASLCRVALEVHGDVCIVDLKIPHMYKRIECHMLAIIKLADLQLLQLLFFRQLKWGSTGWQLGSNPQTSEWMWSESGHAVCIPAPWTLLRPHDSQQLDYRNVGGSTRRVGLGVSPCGNLLITLNLSQDMSFLEHWDVSSDLLGSTQAGSNTTGGRCIPKQVYGSQASAESYHEDEIRVAWNPQPVSSLTYALYDGRGALLIVDGRQQHHRVLHHQLVDRLHGAHLAWSPDGLKLTIATAENAIVFSLQK